MYSRVLPRKFLRDSAPVHINCDNRVWRGGGGGGGDFLQASLQVLLNYRHYSPGAVMSMVEY